MFQAVLSDETVLNIFRYLPPKSLANVSCTCRRLARIASDDLLWRSVHEQMGRANWTSWKELCRHRVAAVKQRSWRTNYFNQLRSLLHKQHDKQTAYPYCMWKLILILFEVIALPWNVIAIFYAFVIGFTLHATSLQIYRQRDVLPGSARGVAVVFGLLLIRLLGYSLGIHSTAAYYGMYVWSLAIEVFNAFTSLTVATQRAVAGFFFLSLLAHVLALEHMFLKPKPFSRYHNFSKRDRDDKRALSAEEDDISLARFLPEQLKSINYASLARFMRVYTRAFTHFWPQQEVLLVDFCGLFCCASISLYLNSEREAHLLVLYVCLIFFSNAVKSALILGKFWNMRLNQPIILRVFQMTMWYSLMTFLGIIVGFVGMHFVAHLEVVTVAFCFKAFTLPMVTLALMLFVYHEAGIRYGIFDPQHPAIIFIAVSLMTLYALALQFIYPESYAALMVAIEAAIIMGYIASRRIVVGDVAVKIVIAGILLPPLQFSWVVGKLLLSIYFGDVATFETHAVVSVVNVFVFMVAFEMHTVLLTSLIAHYARVWGRPKSLFN